VNYFTLRIIIILMETIKDSIRDTDGEAVRPRGHRIEAPWLALPLRPVPALGQEQESGSTGSQARSRGRLGRRSPPMSVAPETGRNRIMGQNPTAPMWSSSKLPTVTRWRRHPPHRALTPIPCGDTRHSGAMRGPRPAGDAQGLRRPWWCTTCSSPSRCIDERHLGTGSRVYHGAGHRGAAIGIVAANCFQLGCVARECPSGGGPSWLRPGMKSEEFDIHP
jgi:hypothetical protein